jgi:SNF2 family DNA or RNA helicase
MTRSRSGKTLRDPQPKSIEGILRVWEHGALVGTGTARGALLADSMGLGKTASACVAASCANMKRILVIAPKAALPDWRREVHNWVNPHGAIHVLRSGQYWLDFNRGWVLVNYEMLEKFASELRARTWDLMILDEAHATKEPTVRRTILIHGGVWREKAYSAIPCRKALVISGTPHKNRVEELFTTLNFLDPDNWPDRDAFIDAHYEEDRIVTPSGRVVQNVALRNLDDLHRKLKSTVLVRTHKDDVQGMPAKRFERILVPLDDDDAREWFDRKALVSEITSRELRAAQRARDYEKARELEERLREIKSVVTQHATRYKRQAILDYLLTLEHKVVVIGRHRELFLDQLARALRMRGRIVLEHNGDNTAHAKATVKKFQEDPSIQFFIGQLSVSNLSLTLTASSHVVFAEIPETRADFDQALDRVHRFGQSAPFVTCTVFALDYHHAGDDALLDALLHWKDVSNIVLDGHDEASTWEWSESQPIVPTTQMVKYQERILRRMRLLVRQRVQAYKRYNNISTLMEELKEFGDEEDMRWVMDYIGEDFNDIVRQACTKIGGPPFPFTQEIRRAATHLERPREQRGERPVPGK